MQDTAIAAFSVTLLTTWGGIYVLLAGIYLLLGWAVSWLNKACLQAYRIQDKECSPKQVRRDFWQSLKSLTGISGMLAAGITLRVCGIGVQPTESSLTSLLLWGVISLLLFDTWFYWFHRLIHQPGLYTKVHRWHHRATTPTVWSNNSDTLLDNLFCQSYWFFAPLILPAPTLVLVLHKVYDQVTGILGHAGYEYAPGRFSSKPSMMIGTSFHDLHHSAFHYNFGTHFSIWDRLMGTLHPDYDELILSYPQDTADCSPQTQTPDAGISAAANKR